MKKNMVLRSILLSGVLLRSTGARFGFCRIIRKLAAEGGR